VSLESDLEARFKFLSEDINSTPWQLVVEMGYDKVEGYREFFVHSVDPL
jgi:hypothetical protein